MTVAELIELLWECPQDSEVGVEVGPDGSGLGVYDSDGERTEFLDLYPEEYEE